MIHARKSAWFSWLFARHARGRITSTFGRVLVRGEAAAREASAASPLLALANHTTFWDPLVILWLSQLVMGADGYAMMDARNLRRLPFFARVGAFGVDLEDDLDGARAVRHAAKLLDRPGRIVWIFPEGEERSPYAPLELRSGAAYVGRVARSARVLPIGLRYVFGAREKPDLWISIGDPEVPCRDASVGVAQQRDAIARELARIDAALPAAGDGFTCIHDARGGAATGVATRLLARLLPLREGAHPASSRRPQGPTESVPSRQRT